MHGNTATERYDLRQTTLSFTIADWPTLTSLHQRGWGACLDFNRFFWYPPKLKRSK